MNKQKPPRAVSAEIDPNGIFATLDYYLEGYMSRQDNATNMQRMQAAINEITSELLADISRAPETIHERRKRGEINALRLSFTKGEEDNYSEVEQHALNLIVMALQDSKPLGEQHGTQQVEVIDGCGQEWVGFELRRDDEVIVITGYEGRGYESGDEITIAWHSIKRI